METALHQTLFTNSLFAYIEFNFLKFPTNIYLMVSSTNPLSSHSSKPRPSKQPE